MKTLNTSIRHQAGFTLVEIMYAMAICVLVVGMALGVFLSGLRMMYKDSQRNATNWALNDVLTSISRKALDSTEYYVFPNYASLDGSVDLDPSSSTCSFPAYVDDAFGRSFAHGDCLVLVARETNSSSSNILYLRIYYRATTDLNAQAPLRVYERSYNLNGTPAGTSTPPTTLLNAINLGSLTTSSSGLTQLAENTIGRTKTSSTDHYPIFCTQTPFPDSSQSNVTVNMEIITGKTSGNILSSSCSNYIISPRK